MGLSFALVCLWSTLNNLGIVNSDLPITAMDTLTMDLDPGTLTTILATIYGSLYSNYNSRNYYKAPANFPSSWECSAAQQEACVSQFGGQSVSTFDCNGLCGLCDLCNTRQAAGVPECATRCASGKAK